MCDTPPRDAPRRPANDADAATAAVASAGSDAKRSLLTIIRKQINCKNARRIEGSSRSPSSSLSSSPLYAAPRCVQKTGATAVQCHLLLPRRQGRRLLAWCLSLCRFCDSATSMNLAGFHTSCPVGLGQLNNQEAVAQGCPAWYRASTGATVPYSQSMAARVAAEAKEMGKYHK